MFDCLRRQPFPPQALDILDDLFKSANEADARFSTENDGTTVLQITTESFGELYISKLPHRNGGPTYFVHREKEELFSLESSGNGKLTGVELAPESKLTPSIEQAIDLLVEVALAVNPRLESDDLDDNTLPPLP